MTQKFSNTDEYFNYYKISQNSEKLFVNEFILPIIGINNLHLLKAQETFIDRTGSNRRIDFSFHEEGKPKIAFEIDGETYHSEGVIKSESFDDSLLRQNELIQSNWTVLRYSYNQLQSPEWREYVSNSIRYCLRKLRSDLLPKEKIEPNNIQREVLKNLEIKRNFHNLDKGVVVMPTGTGKTYLSALDMKRYLDRDVASRGLFIVHENDILSQAVDAYNDVFGTDVEFGRLNGKHKDNIKTSRVLFANKNTLVKKLNDFSKDEFSYIVIDEVHHTAANEYKKIVEYFKPNFMLGMTATPDRHDRRDLMKLFNYQKISEYDLRAAIDSGFLVSIEYHGLTDDIDYSKIRYNGNKYNVEDLDRALNIKSRNEAILEKYNEYIHGDKAIGFCVSIDHANKMAKLFNDNGISAVAIHSNSNNGPTRKNSEELIKDFKDNEYSVAFVVDMFNEGTDIKNTRGLMFLRPTESKTIFIQQLGRGLRISDGKEKIIVLDFIGNYKKAGSVQGWLGKPYGKEKDAKGQYTGKTLYDYGDNITVTFDDKVEQIMNQYDSQNIEYTKDEIIEEYYVLKEKFNGMRINAEKWELESNIPLKEIVSHFGSWYKFCSKLGETTESSYHFPQGFHLGHLLYILYTVNSGKREKTLISDDMIKLHGDIGQDKEGNLRRQTKYKIVALMELGLLVDARRTRNNTLELTEKGKTFVSLFSDLFDTLEFKFTKSEGWQMANESQFNQKIKDYIINKPEVYNFYASLMLNFDAFKFFLYYIYSYSQRDNVPKNEIYQTYFELPCVNNFLNINGIGKPNASAASHRLPFLFNIAESLGILNNKRSEIEITSILISKKLLELGGIEEEEAKELVKAIDSGISISSEQLEILKEFFGSNFGETGTVRNCDNLRCIKGE